MSDTEYIVQLDSYTAVRNSQATLLRHKGGCDYVSLVKGNYEDVKFLVQVLNGLDVDDE